MSLLTSAVADMVIFIAPYPQLQEGYEGGTDDTRASKDCTIDEPVFIANYQCIRLRCKRVVFLGTANHIANYGRHGHLHRAIASGTGRLR